MNQQEPTERQRLITQRTSVARDDDDDVDNRVASTPAVRPSMTLDVVCSAAAKGETAQPLCVARGQEQLLSDSNAKNNLTLEELPLFSASSNLECRRSFARLTQWPSSSWRDRSLRMYFHHHQQHEEEPHLMELDVIHIFKCCCCQLSAREEEPESEDPIAAQTRPDCPNDVLVLFPTKEAAHRALKAIHLRVVFCSSTVATEARATARRPSHQAPRRRFRVYHSPGCASWDHQGLLCVEKARAEQADSDDSEDDKIVEEDAKVESDNEEVEEKEDHQPSTAAHSNDHTESDDDDDDVPSPPPRADAPFRHHLAHFYRTRAPHDAQEQQTRRNGVRPLPPSPPADAVEGGPPTLPHAPAVPVNPFVEVFDEQLWLALRRRDAMAYLDEMMDLVE